MFRGPRARNGVAALVASRVVYAINWLNVGAIFYLMASDLNSGISGLGALTSGFYLGVGLSQVPGGILAARWGPKKVVTIGILVSSIAALATAAGTSLFELSVLRFVVGVGMAFVFAPAVVIVAKLLNGQRTGVGVGIFNSAFNVGGVFGLFVWILVATWAGWRLSLVLSGALGLATAILVFAFVPSDSVEAEFRPTRQGLFQVLLDRQLLFLGLGTLGVSVGNIMISSFLVFYLVNDVGVAGVLAGLVASVVVLVPIASALWAERLYDRLHEPRRLMLTAVLGMGASLALLGAFPGLGTSVVSAVLAGIFSGLGFTVSFASAKELNRASSEYDGLAIAWVNSVSLTSAFWPPLLFSFLAGAFGYEEAWLGSALICVATALAVAMMREGVAVREG